ncbi:MAG TPA: sugar ABC transporter substrate-binding protein [Pseudolysinimonas sp.]|jgi:multiple sugar transport system substrate-binding protein
MKFRKVAAIAAIAGVALAAAGCSAQSGGGSDKGVTLTYWASNQGTSLANDKEVLTPVLDKFTKQTGIKVKLEVIGWDSLQTRINTAVSSGVGPDVVNIGNTWAPYLSATGAFLPYDDANMKAIGGSDKFVATALQTGGLAGKTVTSVPLYGLAYGLFYSKKMFADAGLTPPTTWEEMVADAKKLTDPAKGTWGMSLEAGSYTENVHFAFITAEQNGASLFNGDKPDFTSSPVVDGVQRYLDLMQTDKVVNPSNAQYTDGTGPAADFAKGRAAMIVSQDNAGPTLEANGMSSSDYGVVAIPAPEGGKQVSSGIQGINLSVFKNTKNKDAALQFVKYMTSSSTQSGLGKPYASIPVLKGVTPTFTDDADIAKVFSDVYNNRSKPYPLVPLEGAFETNVGNAINGLFANIATNGSVSSSDIKSALQTAEDKTNSAG